MNARCTAAFAVLIGLPWTASALEIQHTPVGCFRPGQAARIEARLDAPPASTALVVFRAEGSSDWHASALVPADGAWSTVLPAPLPDTTRIAYYIEVEDGTQRRRVPASEAYLADVASSCRAPAAAVPADGLRLLVQAGAPRMPSGFDPRDVRSFVSWTRVLPAAPVATPAPVRPDIDFIQGLPIRVTTRPARGGEGAGRRFEGHVVSVDERTVTIAGKNDARTVVRREDVLRLETKEQGTNLKGIGALVGAVPGVLAAVLVCAAADDMDCGTGALWIGMAGGMVAGAAMAPGGDRWQPIDLVRSRNVRFGIEGGRRKAGARLAISF
jgi:hypothetical protein